MDKIMKIPVLFKQVLLIFPVILLLSNSCKNAQNSGYTTYRELEDTKPFDTLAWKSVDDGINFSVASIDERYRKKLLPPLKPTNLWTGKAWRGERINAQMVIWATQQLKNAHCTITDLHCDKGFVISKENINSYFVRYVMSDEFADGCGNRNPADYDSLLVADALDPIEYLDIEANTTRPVWVTIDVPENCKAGRYSGSIEINADKQECKKIEIDLLVTERQLPRPKDWEFHLDLWQNLFAVARYNNVKLWSEEHFNLMRPLFKRLANAGQKCITASITYKPWGGQTYDHFESLIKWTKNKNGTWGYDYADFDRWIEFSMDCGITGQINCYSMIPWGNKITYFDQVMGKDTMLVAIPGTGLYEKLWAPFLKQFVDHLKLKGLQSITTIAMDERALEDMQKMISFLKTVAPELKISLAGSYHEEISDDLYDLCVASAHIVPNNAMIKRKDTGYKTTFYVCCVEPYPNNFTFSPPAESAYMGWYAAAKGYDGFLRWAYNSWTRNPLTDSRFCRWPAGDTYLVYPGNISSIRFERLREGIQDFEKIRILSRELKDDGSPEALVKLEKLEDLLILFEIDSLEKTPAEIFVNKGKKVLADLSN